MRPRPGTHHAELTEAMPDGVARGEGDLELGGFRVLKVHEPAGDSADELLDTLRASPTIDAGTHVFETSDDHVPFVPTGEIFLEYADGTSADEMQRVIEENKLQILEARGPRTFIVRVTPGSVNPIKASIALQQSPAVEIAEPDLATPGSLKATSAPTQFVPPSDDLLSWQWHLDNTGLHRGHSVGFRKGADARVRAAWEAARTLGDPSVTVAVIDDGFDLGHPDISGPAKVVAPWDFTRRTDSPAPDFDAANWHGTACAGVAVGSADTAGIVGAAPHSTLMPIRWGRGLTDGEIEDWFGWATDHGASVVSCSWGATADVFHLSTRMARAITRCATQGRGGRGCVVVFAAGNDSQDIDDPDGSYHDGFANHPDVIAVAASTSMDERSDYSNFGKAVSICAPSDGAGGWGITTSDVRGTFVRGGVRIEAGYAPGPYDVNFGGTSSACPLVAGVAALVLSLNPSVSAQDVKSVLERTARQIGDPASYVNGHSPFFGHGCVDALAAVTAASGKG